MQLQPLPPHLRQADKHCLLSSDLIRSFVVVATYHF
jgi:hypothetical protein